MMMKHLKRVILALCLIGFIALGVSSITKHDNKLKLKDVQIKSTQSDLIQLNLKYDLLNTDLKKELDSKDHNEEKIKQLEQEKIELQKQQEALQAELQAKADRKAADLAKLQHAASITPTAYAATSCGDNQYASFIYQHESGCRTDAVNSIGCKGIGQRCGDLPCTLQDYACQNNWFTNYAETRYNGWYGAYLFWQQHHWW